MSMLNIPIVLAIPHLTPAIQKTTCIIPRGIVLWLRRICDDEIVNEGKNYLKYFEPTILNALPIELGCTDS